MGKYYYILGSGTLCWEGKDLETARKVFEDTQYDELYEVSTFLGVDIKERLIDFR